MNHYHTLKETIAAYEGVTASRVRVHVTRHRCKRRAWWWTAYTVDSQPVLRSARTLIVSSPTRRAALAESIREVRRWAAMEAVAIVGCLRQS